ncbi:MAG: cupin domain-containing protein [Pseudonocardiales bacterium]|nr:cupin domain-containing protein [Pseudonocardiales bacterium]
MSFPTPPSDRSDTDRHDRNSHGFVLGPDEGQAYQWLGSLSLTKVLGRDTGGRLDLVDHRVPAGYAPPRHVHRDADEVFYIVDGTLEVTCGDESWRVGPGSVVFLPRGVPHGFVAGPDGPARTLLINAGAGFADVVAELGTRTSSVQLPGQDAPMPDPEQIAEVSARHGIDQAPSRGASN